MFRSSMHKTQRNKVWAVQDGTILSNVDEAISPNFAEPRCSKIVNEMSSSLAAMYRFKELSINNDVPRNSTPPPLQPPRLSSRHTRKAKTYNPQLADISSIRESTTAAKADAWDVALPLLDYQDSLLSSSLSSSISLSSPQTPSKPTSAFLAAAAAASSATCSSGYTLPSHPLDPPTLRPSPSTRLKNAFRRLSMQEVVHSRSSSLAERIKSKFQQRSSIKRSTSLSSISSSWSRFSKPSRKSNSSTVTVSPLESKMQVHDSLILDKKDQQRSPRRPLVVRFAPLVSIKETFSRHEYDRGCDPDAACKRLTSAMVQRIKDELNFYKLQEMHVHEQSRIYTHFFL